MCEREEGEISEMRRREKETMLLCCASVGFFFLMGIRQKRCRFSLSLGILNRAERI